MDQVQGDHLLPVKDKEEEVGIFIEGGRIINEETGDTSTNSQSFTIQYT